MSNEIQSLFVNIDGLDPKSMDILSQALASNNLPGFDYIEFKQSLVKLKAMQMDETTAFKSAFVTASTVGLTKEKLIETAAHYKQVLIKEKEQFNVALQKQQDQKIAGKLKEIATLKEQLTQFQNQIKQLEEKIAAAQSTIRDADFTIEKDMEKIESTKQNFMSTHESILKQIDTDVDNINIYL